MRLLSLTIENIRGIRKQTFPLDGKSLVIWGPNGSGKSSIVDAIDFLFTGRISRLVGEGTKGITLSRHGPHIDWNSETSFVKASVKLAEFQEPIAIYRCMARPGDLVCPAAAEDAIAAIGVNIQNGGVILTRRDILNFVTSEAGKRADEIQNILKLKEIDVIRESLQRAKTELQRREQKAQDAVQTAIADVNAILGDSNFSVENLLKVVNTCRQTLGGNPLDAPESSKLKHSLSPPTLQEAGPIPFNRTLFEQSMQQLQQYIHPDTVTDRAKHGEGLRAYITKLKANEKLLDEFKKLELTLKAMSFVDDSTTECPVCDAGWPKGHLKDHLDKKVGRCAICPRCKIQNNRVSRRTCYARAEHPGKHYNYKQGYF